MFKGTKIEQTKDIEYEKTRKIKKVINSHP